MTLEHRHCRRRWAYGAHADPVRLADSPACARLSGALEHDGPRRWSARTLDCSSSAAKHYRCAQVSAERVSRAFRRCTVIIDFTLPAATLDNMQAARDALARQWSLWAPRDTATAQEDVVLGFAEASPHDLGRKLLPGRQSAAQPRGAGLGRSAPGLRHRRILEMPSPRKRWDAPLWHGAGSWARSAAQGPWDRTLMP